MKLESPSWYDSKKIVTAVFKSTAGANYYVATTKYKYEHQLMDDPIIGKFLSDKQHTRISDVLGDMSGCNHFYLAYSADCAFPPLYIVCADSESDIEEIFIDETDICKVFDTDLKDYNLDSDECTLQLDSNGKYHDTEALTWHELTLVALLYE